MLQTPTDYALCLEWTAKRDGLQKSELSPVMMSEMLAVESELRVDLPDQYEDFLAEVGAGAEYGGLAVWLHLDLTQHGNLVEVNKRLWEEGAIPRAMLVVYDPLEGDLYGFKRADRGKFDGRVYSITPGEPKAMRVAASSFLDFLSSLVDCSASELEAARREHSHHHSAAHRLSDAPSARAGSPALAGR